MTSWNERPEPLLSGPVRAYTDNAAKQIVVETTKFNPAGSGLEVCRLAVGRVAEARAIVALPDLLKGVEPFAALGRELAQEDGEAPLITDPAVKLEITVGDLQRIAEAWARAFPPAQDMPPGARLRRGLSKKFRPKG